MQLSADEAILHFHKWVQESTHLRLILSIPSVSLSAEANGKFTSATMTDDREHFPLDIGGFKLKFLAADAVLEYVGRREAQLLSIGLSEANFACCLNAIFRDPLKPASAFSDAAFILCELLLPSRAVIRLPPLFTQSPGPPTFRFRCNG